MSIIGHHGVLLGGLRRFIIPLTYDEYLSDDTTPLVRNGIAPWITPDGFYGNGYNSRYSLFDAEWITANINYLQATITPLRRTLNTAFSRDVIVGLGSANPFLQLSVLQDPANTSWLCVGFRGRDATNTDQNYPIVRQQWKFEGRYPQLKFGGHEARPQAIEFNVGDDGCTLAAHYEDQESIFHVLDASKNVIGQYTFGGPSHVATMARDGAGRLWATDYTTGILYRIDESASLSSGNFTPDLTYNLDDIMQVGSIEFITVSGTEYLLAGQYFTSGVPYIYVIPKSIITDGGKFLLGDRYKRFVCEHRVQGITNQGGTLYVAGNRIGGDAAAFGRVYTYNIASAITSLADGGSLTIVDSWQAPTEYPEDVSFDSSGRLWTMTEGQLSVGDREGFLSLWSTAFIPQENTYGVLYDENGITIKINNLLWGTIAFESGDVLVDRVEIGGPTSEVEGVGWTTGYFSGYVKNIYFANALPGPVLYQQIVDGDFEPNTLTAYPLTIVNPGAESGTTGWTNETGSIGTRSSNPAPYQGSAYFFGGPNLQTISRQSIDLLAVSGLSQGELDASDAWVSLSWHQAAFGGTDNDLGGLGLAFTDGGSETARNYSGLINVGVQEWFMRNFTSELQPGDDAVRIIYRSDRNSGTNNDGYVDSMSAVLYVKP